jgi:putative DNA primase/helicase
VFCHHAGDPLSSEHAHDAFDVFRLLEHGGDYRTAVKAAAQALYLGRSSK